jgi:site-specific recombinase XerD
MTFDESLTEFLLAKDHSPASRTWYRSRLGAFFTWATTQGVTTLEGVSAPLVRRYLDHRRATPSYTGRPLDSHTLHGHTRVIRAWLHWAVADGLVDAVVPARIGLPKREQKVLRVLSPQQCERLLLTAAQSTQPPRDQAVVAVLLDTGLRAAELCALNRDDVHLTPDEAYVLVRHGKGRRQREVPLGVTSRRWLARLLRSHHAPEVFAGPRGPLTPSGLDQLLERLMTVAGPQHFTGLKRGAHLFRHTFAVRFLEAGGDVYVLSRLMGHSTVSTTEGYLRAVTARQVRQHALSPLDALRRPSAPQPSHGRPAASDRHGGRW